MKLFLKILFIAILFTLTVFSSFGQYVTLEGRQFKDEHDSNFYPVVCNYIVNHFYMSDPAFYDTASLFFTPDSDGWEIQCDGTSICDSQFYHNFLEIKHMNFNTIRLFGITPVYKCLEPLSVGEYCGFRIAASHRFPYIYPDSIYKHLYPIRSPFNSDSIVQRMFYLMDKVLVQANHAGLKVILLAAGMKGKFYPELDTIYYPEWLSTLAYHIANESPQEARDAIMAYDLLNEPYSSNQTGYPWGGSAHSKRAVCNRVANWYNAIKTIDPAHLVTMGAGSATEITKYDLNVMKLDFASPHYYARKFPSYELDSLKVLDTLYSSDSITKRLDAMVKRYHGNLYWLCKNSVMPFIIGETGFAAQDTILSSATGTDGDTLQQRQYAEITQRITRNCLGSGYSWWKYQDSYWGDDEFEDYLGLLRRGICNPPCDSLEKPVVKAFMNFDPNFPPGTCTPPDNYFNLFNHPDSCPNIIHGNVNDDYGNPIKDVVANGSTFLYINDVNKQPIYDIHYTFSDNSGNFKIIPYDYVGQQERNIIESLWISAPGCTRIFKQHQDSIPIWNPLIDSANYILTQKRWDYDGKIDNTIIQSDEPAFLQGWNSLSLTDIMLETSSELTISARDNIEINHEFEAYRQGDEILIECVPTFPICSDFDPVFKTSSLVGANYFSGNKHSEIELSFLLSKDVFDFIVFPNPGSGLFTVSVTNQDPIKVELDVEIINFLGINVFNMMTKETTFDIDISAFQKGIYFIKISTYTDSKTQKLILQ